MFPKLIINLLDMAKAFEMAARWAAKGAIKKVASFDSYLLTYIVYISSIENTQDSLNLPWRP